MSDASREHGGPEIAGRLYYPNGVRVDQRVQIIARARGWTRSVEVRSTDPGCEIGADGSFRLRLPEGEQIPQSELELVVNSTVVEPKRLWRTDLGDYAVILPPDMPIPYGSEGRGRIITGTVVDENGYPVGGAKLGGEVNAGGVFGFFTDTEVLAASSRHKSGHFALEFTGGTELKRLFVDGAEPARVFVERESEEIDVPKRGLRAGSFGLRVVRVKRLLGIF